MFHPTQTTDTTQVLGNLDNMLPGEHVTYHMDANVESDERMEPPIQTLYFLSGGATTRTLMAGPPSSLTSLNSLAARAGEVEPTELVMHLFYEAAPQHTHE